MKLARALSESEEKRIQTLILYGGVFTTLAIWTNLEDPVNLPKMFVLILFAAGIFGLTAPAYFHARNLISKDQKITLVLIALFIFGLLGASLMTEVKYTAFFGEYHRNNGFFSYFAMAILMSASIFVFRTHNSKRYITFFSNTGLFLTAYGFLQGVGKDPISWVITYNPFITTLGNPNFTSAILGISGIAILYLALESDKNFPKAIYAIGLILTQYILYRSGSIQGLFGFAIGATIVITVKLWLVKRGYGLASAALTVVMAIPVALAVLNIGPLASKLYQGTLRNRMDYWNAAIGMFKDHPIAGIGIDRFGEYYRQYAVQNQVVQGQSTDNAHSVYLQIFSTGGLITGLPYLILILFVTIAGLRSIFRSSSSDRLRVATVFSIWVAMLAVNIVTIDNLGVAVWFWITAGVLVSLSFQSNEIKVDKEKVNKSKKSRKRLELDTSSNVSVLTVISFSLVVLVLVTLIPIISNSNSLFNLKKNIFPQTSQSQISAIVEASKRSDNNPQQLIQLANLALSKNSPRESLSIINRINEIDSRSYYGTLFAAIVYEAISEPRKALKYREKLLIIDTWGTNNMLQVMRIYISLGDRAKAIVISDKISNYFPGSQAQIEADNLLAP
jgi:O-antigen ligase